MSTKIEWTDATWNPVTGCDRCSPGCDHCYIERTPPFRIEGRRFDEHGKMGVRLHPERLDKPLHWRKPRRVFVNSLSDLFHPDVPADFVARVFNIMGLADRHTFQVLTKRPKRMSAMANLYYESTRQEPLPNVWLGVSVENQRYADLRIPHLLQTPAAVRFLSCEPLLGPVDLAMDHECGDPPHWSCPPTVDWVIAGGESGPGARPMHPDWARSLRDQCQAAEVPFFFKQWGEWAALDPPHVQRTGVRGSRNWTEIDGQELWKIGKKRAGRELDGRTWDEYPEAL